MLYISKQGVVAMKCQQCGSLDVRRLRRSILERVYIRRIFVCNECSHIQKEHKYIRD